MPTYLPGCGGVTTGGNFVADFPMQNVPDSDLFPSFLMSFHHDGDPAP